MHDNYDYLYNYMIKDRGLRIYIFNFIKVFDGDRDFILRNLYDKFKGSMGECEDLKYR